MEKHQGRRADLAAEIRAELARQGKSRAALAEAMGISSDTLRRRLDGHKPFKFDELVSAGAFLGLSLVELVSRTEAA